MVVIVVVFSVGESPARFYPAEIVGHLPVFDCWLGNPQGMQRQHCMRSAGPPESSAAIVVPSCFATCRRQAHTPARTARTPGPDFQNLAEQRSHLPRQVPVGNWTRG
jgi:hypothetical protein